MKRDFSNFTVQEGNVMKRIPLYLSTAALMGLPVLGWSAVISGTVLSGVAGTVASNPVVGATVVMSSYAGGSSDSLESVTTDATGSYSFQDAPTGPVEVSTNPPGFSSGFLIVAVNSNDTTISGNMTLVDSSQNPNIKSDANIVGRITNGSAAVINAKVLLRRRATATSSYVIVDSAFSDGNGVFSFDSILAVGTGQIANAYTLVVGAYSDSANSYAVFTSGNLTVGDGITLISNIALTATGVRTAISGNKAQDLRFSVAGDHLLLNLGVSSAARTVSIYGMNGALEHQISVSSGESSVMVPAMYAPKNGFVFQVK